MVVRVVAEERALAGRLGCADRPDHYVMVARRVKAVEGAADPSRGVFDHGTELAHCDWRACARPAPALRPLIPAERRPPYAVVGSASRSPAS